jgi:hypothetical protein
MPKQSYPLEKDGPRRLELTWKVLWKDLNVRLDGESIGVIPTHRELTDGKEFTLPDQSILKVRLIDRFYLTDLQVLRDGQPLPGSASDPLARLRIAYILLYLIAGLNLALGLAAELFQFDFLLAMGMGPVSLVFGLVMLALAFFVQRRSRLALVLAMLILAVDGLIGVALALTQGYPPSIAGFVVRLLLIVAMFPGLGAIRELKNVDPKVLEDL